MKVWHIVLLFFWSALLLGVQNADKRIHAQTEDISMSYCIHSFDTFAYGGPRDEDESPVQPSTVWQIDDVLGNYLESNNYRIINLNFIHQSNDNDTLWLLAEGSSANIWIAYTPETNTIQTYPDTLVYDSHELYISDVYVDTNDNVWGVVRSNRSSVYAPSQLRSATNPVLAKLDYERLQFVPEIEIFDTSQEKQITVVFDRKDSFWLLVENDGIYQYIPSQQSTVKVVSIPELHTIWYVSQSFDGSIYYQTSFQSDRIYYLNEENVFKFSPETNTVVSLGQPNEEWPLNKGILADEDNRLWLGSIGYRTANGNWHLTHSNPNGYSELEVQYNWASPSPILETSDSRLWFSNLWDGGYNFQGTAWYDPISDEGCMFTNLPVSLLEGSSQRVWMVADGLLYSAHLSEI